MRKSRWHPTTIERFIKAFPTSACTALVKTDAGMGYLKALGGSEGPHILACELVGTKLAAWFGLATFDFALVDVTDTDEVPFHKGGAAEVGTAFITRAESGEPWSGDAKQLDFLSNLQDISRLVVFDTWTLNCDRYSLHQESGVTKARINRNNVFLSEEAPKGRLLLKAMDHTHCFTCGKELSRNLRHIDKIKDPRVFGLFPEFHKHLDRAQVKRAARDLGRMNRTHAVRMTEGIPDEWEVTGEAIDALQELIVNRASFVASSIEGQLWPEGELDSHNPKADEP